MSDCLFCKIVSNEIPSKKVYEDDRILAFYDINPAAPVHILVIPKEHIESLAALQDEHLGLIGYLHGKIRDIARDLKLADGYRVVNNCGKEGGQEVGHLHFHLLGGRKMLWPPG
ncbi:MAG TPA: histidine triad nucleotide-binding protein [Peptococcaceae bacterium]|jgi:histidine triad (HIT) family protein|nr:histidine triad nucleotide-binding protein [Clostridia bacterium]HOB82308.1 histidine triad nucleotide-binding protein [Peptococcaceae bacterium]HPZ72053.1 histidine triad nucleotide-binding protein [Peptococcaceae bacterium]HQD54082.1 histidine triad nucleotide-binding protein [Peptococcaceae bacterium]